MNDLNLWQELKDGKKTALERIYASYAPILLKYGKKFSRNDALIEDCLQDLFIELWRNREGLSPVDSIQRYLYVAFRRKVIRNIEKSKKQVSDYEPNELDFEAEISIDEKLIEAEFSSERAAQLKIAMEQLSKRQKEVIYLKYINGMDYEDIGEIMDLNYQSARNLVSNALSVLKKQLLTAVYLPIIDILIDFL